MHAVTVYLDTAHTYVHTYLFGICMYIYLQYCGNMQCDLCNQSGILHACVKVCGSHGAIEVVVLEQWHFSCGSF